MSTEKPFPYLPLLRQDFDKRVEEFSGNIKKVKIELLQEITLLFAQIQKNIQDNQSIDSEKREVLSNKLNEIQAELNITDDIVEKLDRIIGSFAGDFYQKLPVDVRFEREYYTDFYKYLTSPKSSFQSDFLRLISGLDKDSVQTVVLSIQRLKLIMQSNEAFIALYTEKEFSMMKQRMDYFYSSFLELSKECFFWNGYLLPINHFEACVFEDQLMIHHLEHPDRYQNSDIIDAGAFIGDSALVLSRLTTGRVHAFEPAPENYNIAKQTIEMNSLSNVILSPLALGIGKGTATLSISGSASSQFENSALTYDKTISVETISVDEYVNENKLHIGLIKADIEGAEHLMLRGAIETIKSQKPSLLISIYHNADDYFKIKPWIESLELGYKFKIRHSVCGSVLTDTMLIAEVY